MYNFFGTTNYRQQTTDSRSGFTLIELLVVVAIIGILSVAAFATLGGTRGKARDARRLSDIKQMQLILTIENTTLSGSRSVTGCTGNKANTCTGPGDVSNFSLFKDPSEGASPVVCATGGSLGCTYGIYQLTTALKTDDYKLCFYLEDPGTAGLSSSPGVYRVTSTGGTGGAIAEAGC